MRRIISFITIFILLFVVGCTTVEEPKILVDEQIDVYIGEDYLVLPTLKGVKGEVGLIYESLDESIFVVSNDNYISPVSLGSADLLIKLENTEVQVKVLVNVLGREVDIELEFQNTNFNILKGEELTLVLLGNGEKILKDITWSSSDESVASIDSNGVVLGKASGTTTIEASYKGKKVETIITVNNTTEVDLEVIKVSGIKIVEIGEIIMLKAKTDISPATFVFTSLNEDIATVTSSGVLKGISEGIATIKVSLVEDASVSVSFDITIKTPILDISVSPSSEMVIGDNETTLIVRDSKGISIGRHLCDFRSLDESILEISSDGIITAVGVGTTSIEVKHNNSIGYVEIIVNEAPEINYRNLIVETAIKEFGYVEGPNNDTKYGTWYGMPNQPWCAMFVSWSAHQVGIPQTVIPKYAAVAAGLAWYQAKGSDFYKSYEETQNGDYVPICGDIVFFKSNGASHTGIVVKVVGDIMYTIEGNTSNRVALRYYYYKSYDKITGYGIPNYQASSTPIYDFDVTRATFGGGVSTT